MNGQRRGGRTKRGGSSRHMGRKKMRGRSRAEEEQKKSCKPPRTLFSAAMVYFTFCNFFPGGGGT